ncbi:hypothetical protein KUTeg_011909 [Tegillarca granosa]|uniref:Uncharacterized protein n=1 Tax=Tegillarca granosa TaxID=220873 RepID=A0ABQ9EY01_TEGGR|nr:hypothetical protein KUTeg_011909 [Tegillarca granosa]
MQNSSVSSCPLFPDNPHHCVSITAQNMPHKRIQLSIFLTLHTFSMANMKRTLRRKWKRIISSVSFIVIQQHKTAPDILIVILFLFMIAVIWLFKKYTAFAQRLILYLSIAALFDSISYLMGGLRPDGPMCDFQAWWLTFFDWCVLLWVSCITFNLFMNVVKNRVTDKYECWIASAWQGTYDPDIERRKIAFYNRFARNAPIQEYPSDPGARITDYEEPPE